MVETVSLDWKWLFIYPEQGVASVNELVVPVDRPIEFRLTSSSVMNAFYIPSMAGMIYSMPGMETTLHGIFNAEGTFQGMASHYSGAGFLGHAVQGPCRHRRRLRPVGGRDARGRRRAGPGRVPGLARPSENVAPHRYGAVDAQLFPRVVNMCVEDGKICMAEMMDLDRQGGTGLAGTMNMQSLVQDRVAQRGERAPTWAGNPSTSAGSVRPPRRI